jgi:potassium-transporting ATPase KdpC subunit
MNSLATQARTAALMLGILSLITGVAYPLAVTALAQGLFPSQANGSLILDGGRVIGSALIGQPFSDPRYFWGRLSATGTFPYNPFNAADLTGSSGSNYGPSNPALAEAARARISALRAADPGNTSPVPVDLVTSSASGLDPDISLAAAYFQVGRVARVRGLSTPEIRALVAKVAQGRQLGVLGEPRVNVLRLNLALDELR